MHGSPVEHRDETAVSLLLTFVYGGIGMHQWLPTEEASDSHDHLEETIALDRSCH